MNIQRRGMINFDLTFNPWVMLLTGPRKGPAGGQTKD